MKKWSVKLLIFICAVMVASFAAVYLLYNAITRENIRSKAELALNYMFDLTDDSEYLSDPTSYSISVISTDEDYERDEYDSWLKFSSADYNGSAASHDSYSGYSGTDINYDKLYPLEATVLNWYRSEDIADETIYTIKQDGVTIYTARQTADSGYFIYYIDVSSEINMLSSFQLIFWIVMVLCITGGGLLGMLFGRHIEHDQQRQKQFFENASHDLKTPLMAIQGYAEGLDKGVIPDTTHAYHVILEESERMASLVDEIMLLSKLENGSVKLNKETISLSDLIEDSLMSIEYQAGEKHIEIHLDIDERNISADRGQMERVMTNLLSNALRHAETEINISCNNKDLLIWNDCEMLSEEDLSAVFERFHTGRNGNTGIGLSLTKEIVERHGWKITAENSSRSGKGGVCFRIRF